MTLTSRATPESPPHGSGSLVTGSFKPSRCRRYSHSDQSDATLYMLLRESLINHNCEMAVLNVQGYSNPTQHTNPLGSQ